MRLVDLIHYWKLLTYTFTWGSPNSEVLRLHNVIIPVAQVQKPEFINLTYSYQLRPSTHLGVTQRCLIEHTADSHARHMTDAHWNIAELALGYGLAGLWFSKFPSHSTKTSSDNNSNR
jgi:hypothetical protein